MTNEEAKTELIKMNNTLQYEQAIKDCRNCKYGRYNDHYETRFCYNSNDCIDWNLWEPTELLPAQQWTPCSERSPEENEFYLATIYSRAMHTVFCEKLFYGAPQLCKNKKIGWYFMLDNGDVEPVFNVKAWMPLPEPWKGK